MFVCIVLEFGKTQQIASFRVHLFNNHTYRTYLSVDRKPWHREVLPRTDFLIQRVFLLLGGNYQPVHNTAYSTYFKLVFTD